MNNLGERPEPPPLIETTRTERIFADGLAKVVVEKHRLHLVYYRESVPIEEGSGREREVAAIITVPIDAAMPALRLWLHELSQNMGAIIADKGEFFWVR